MKTDSLTMTIPEVAKTLGISRGLAYELAKKDELPIKVLRLGEKRMCVSRLAVLTLLDGNSQSKLD